MNCLAKFIISRVCERVKYVLTDGLKSEMASGLLSFSPLRSFLSRQYAHPPRHAPTVFGFMLQRGAEMMMRMMFCHSHWWREGLYAAWEKGLFDWELLKSDGANYGNSEVQKLTFWNLFRPELIILFMALFWYLMINNQKHCWIWKSQNLLSILPLLKPLVFSL